MPMPIHPLAAIIPPMDADEMEKLTADIAQNGLLEPIVLCENQILDGRHRYQACLSAGVEPKFVEFTGADAVSYVLSKNLHRRHLTAAQKAAIAAEVLPMLEAKAKERQRLAGGDHGNQYTGGKVSVPQKIAEPAEGQEARDQAAALTGTNRQYVSDAKKIAAAAPEVFAAMKAGTVSMPEAKALAAKPEPVREEILSSFPVMTPNERRAQFRVVPPEPPAEAPDAVDEPEPEPPAPAPTNRLAVHYSSDSPEWYTPPEVLDRVIACLGSIDLDPCANPERTVPAATHYTADDDGLSREWHGKIFMNPPYGREIGGWAEKLTAEFESGRVTQAIALVPARVDTAWFRQLSRFPVAFWRGRITFVGPDGAQNPAPFPSALFALGITPERFAETFDGVADVFVRVRQGE